MGRFLLLFLAIIEISNTNFTTEKISTDCYKTSQCIIDCSSKHLIKIPEFSPDNEITTINLKNNEITSLPEKKLVAWFPKIEGLKNLMNRQLVVLVDNPFNVSTHKENFQILYTCHQGEQSRCAPLPMCCTNRPYNPPTCSSKTATTPHTSSSMITRITESDSPDSTISSSSGMTTMTIESASPDSTIRSRTPISIWVTSKSSSMSPLYTSEHTTEGRSTHRTTASQTDSTMTSETPTDSVSIWVPTKTTPIRPLYTSKHTTEKTQVTTLSHSSEGGSSQVTTVRYSERTKSTTERQPTEKTSTVSTTVRTKERTTEGSTLTSSAQPTEIPPTTSSKTPKSGPGIAFHLSITAVAIAIAVAVGLICVCCYLFRKRRSIRSTVPPPPPSREQIDLPRALRASHSSFSSRNTEDTLFSERFLNPPRTFEDYSEIGPYYSNPPNVSSPASTIGLSTIRENDTPTDVQQPEPSATPTAVQPPQAPPLPFQGSLTQRNRLTTFNETYEIPMSIMSSPMLEESRIQERRSYYNHLESVV